MTAALARLAAAPWLEDARPFFVCLDGAAGRTRAVGGIVRDTLLGMARAGADIDLATELLPETVIARAQAAGIAAYPTGIAHGTVTLVGREARAEVTTLREDVETDGRRARVVFGTDWARDAARRDFTMNALYCGADGALFDPLGGLSDCLARRVRFIGDPDARIAEDRLRVYRYFRFAASHGGQRFEAEALAACARAAHALGRLSAERVGAEITRLLDLPRVASTLGEMAKTGILPQRLFGAETLAALGRYEHFASCPEKTGRLAILLASGADPEDLKRRWRLSGAVVTAAVTLASASELALAEAWNDLAYRYPTATLAALDVAAARGGWSREELDAIARRLPPPPPPFPLTGNDLLASGMPSGPALGAERDRLERLWIDSGFALDRQALLAALRLPPREG